MTEKKAVAIVSGGMDSVTLVYILKALEYDVHMVSFNYGQRHAKELICAAKIAELTNSKHSIISLPITEFLTGSSLTDRSVDVPDGHYAQDNMKLTVVPNRNQIMLSIAAGIAIAEQASLLATAVHSGDHAIYPKN